ncbi:ABC transporter ATP-binding protein [Caldovatus sediminis]|uniref:ABC transporter ATP-binding protein n=1 Tax=Caldovatus sediminis TaxID=2041189 RepID=A0A8J2ZCD7_9PROT|nr:ABC transporter ATP-binding protein [Caldovatus sediminis]GGG36367.1 ABC transporter ATP-binding protein [Caldovatus sediminis]
MEPAAGAVAGVEELRVENLAKRFGGLRVLEGISFALAPGDLLGVIGPNGAGKTTLINVITGRTPPSGGRILLGGQDITGRPTHAVSRLGVVRSFQQTNTFKAASVRENVSRALRFSGGAGPQGWARVAPLLDAFGLAPRLGEQSDKLPYGLQKMLGLTLAYAANPKVLLLDEPAAGLERSERTRVDEFVRHVRACGCSVLIVEHDMDLVRRLCPRIIVLDAGVVLAEGPPAEVLARQDVIAAYVGADAAGDEAA